MADTLQSEWYSTQNDEDKEIGYNKWSPTGNPFQFYVCRPDGAAQDNFLRLVDDVQPSTSNNLFTCAIKVIYLSNCDDLW